MENIVEKTLLGLFGLLIYIDEKFFDKIYFIYVQYYLHFVGLVMYEVHLIALKPLLFIYSFVSEKNLLVSFLLVPLQQLGSHQTLIFLITGFFWKDYVFFLIFKSFIQFYTIFVMVVLFLSFFSSILFFIWYNPLKHISNVNMLRNEMKWSRKICLVLLTVSSSLFYITTSILLAELIFEIRDIYFVSASNKK